MAEALRAHLGLASGRERSVTDPPPKPPAPIALKPQPFNPSWVLPLLDRLERALKREGKRERDEWGFRIAQLRKSIDEHTKEKSH